MTSAAIESVMAEVQGDSSLQLHRNLRRLIERGQLAAGSPLPSERDLARRLQLARGTVRQALARLQKDGLIDCSHGRIRRVAERTGKSEPDTPRPRGLLASTIAVLATQPNPEQIPGFTPAWDPFIQITAAKRFEQHGYHLLNLHPRSLGGDASPLLADPPAGVMAMHEVGESPEGRSILADLVRAGVPVVVYGDSPELAPFDHVASDHRRGAMELTRWLLARGRRRILRLWRFPQQHHWVTQRDRGYTDALAPTGCPVLPPVRTPELEADVEHREQFDHVVRVLAGYLYEHVVAAEEPIDALMLATDSHAVEAAAALRYLGKQPNLDIDLVGYDHVWPHLPAAQWEAVGPLATVDKNNPAIAERMVALLTDRIAGRLDDTPQLVRLAPTLIQLPAPAERSDPSTNLGHPAAP